MLLALGSLIAGIVLLIKGADWLVDGAASIARRFGVTELTIGLTIVAFGTSMPELIVNIISSFSGANDIAIGNIVGSNISNTLLILGAAAAISPIAVQNSTVWKEIPFSLLAGALLLIMANDHIVDGYTVSELSRSDGLAYLGFFLIFLWYSFGMRRHSGDTDDEAVTDGHHSTWIATGLIVLGLAGLSLGGQLTVSGAISIAELLKVSQAFIAITVVAVGTSLPELATSIVAARKNKADLAVGNIIGSNIFNVFWILGLSAAIQPLTFQPSMNIDLVVLMVSTIALFFFVHNGSAGRRLFLFWRQRDGHVLTRWEGMILLSLYVSYVLFLVHRL